MHERLKGLRAERERGRDRIARLPEQTEKGDFCCLASLKTHIKNGLIR